MNEKNDQIRKIDQKANAFHRNVRRLPRIVRIFLGLFLMVGGIFGFLPILGFWMVPVGLAVLAVDFPIAHRAWERLRGLIGRWVGKEKGSETDSQRQKRNGDENER